MGASHKVRFWRLRKLIPLFFFESQNKIVYLRTERNSLVL